MEYIKVTGESFYVHFRVYKRQGIAVLYSNESSLSAPMGVCGRRWRWWADSASSTYALHSICFGVHYNQTVLINVQLYTFKLYCFRQQRHQLVDFFFIKIQLSCILYSSVLTFVRINISEYSQKKINIPHLPSIFLQNASSSLAFIMRNAILNSSVTSIKIMRCKY